MVAVERIAEFCDSTSCTQQQRAIAAHAPHPAYSSIITQQVVVL